ncbi:MAG: response regulator [Anaerolineae bacterium]|nr:response regulator [Anaerolineae bacterium]
MKPKRIAIIEDEPSLGLVFSDVFSLEGSTILLIQEGAEAVQKLKAFMPDIITLDLHLPHVSGVEILRDIRADVQLSDCRVIIVTADPGAAQSVADLADMVLIKPVSLTDLIQLIDRLNRLPAVPGE